MSDGRDGRLRCVIESTLSARAAIRALQCEMRAGWIQSLDYVKDVPMLYQCVVARLVSVAARAPPRAATSLACVSLPEWDDALLSDQVSSDSQSCLSATTAGSVAAAATAPEVFHEEPRDADPVVSRLRQSVIASLRTPLSSVPVLLPPYVNDPRVGNMAATVHALLHTATSAILTPELRCECTHAVNVVLVAATGHLSTLQLTAVMQASLAAVVYNLDHSQHMFLLVAEMDCIVQRCAERCAAIGDPQENIASTIFDNLPRGLRLERRVSAWAISVPPSMPLSIQWRLQQSVFFIQLFICLYCIVNSDFMSRSVAHQLLSVCVVPETGTAARNSHDMTKEIPSHAHKVLLRHVTLPPRYP